MHMLTLDLHDAADTERAGAALAPALAGGMVVALEGELGAGKTTLARGVLRARGVEGPVRSPSYALVEHYPLSSIYFYHIDFYRFTRPGEWDESGLSDCFRDDAVCIVEWPQRVAGLLPAPDLSLRLVYANGGRRLDAIAHTDAGDRCVAALASEFTAPTRS
jgi:tRNA threonylcarbamoyladenosine biosynthesis protein TsaE